MSAQRIESVINNVLTGDARVNSLDFIAYLRANGISPGESESYWEIKHRDECVCYLLIDGSDEAPGPWTIWSDQAPGTWIAWADGEHADVSLDEHIKEVAWANVNPCGNCGGDCSPGKRKTVLGKTFDHLCASALAFTNPSAEMLACAKKMIEARISDINGAA